MTFGRAGEDKKFSKLGDVEATLQGFAGADYDLQVSTAQRMLSANGSKLASSVSSASLKDRTAQQQHATTACDSSYLHNWVRSRQECGQHTAYGALQDALVGATDKKNGQHEKDGELFYDYEVTGAVSSSSLQHYPGAPAEPIKIFVSDGCLIMRGCSFLYCVSTTFDKDIAAVFDQSADSMQDLHYLASITLKSGKVFALFVKSPTKVSL